MQTVDATSLSAKAVADWRINYRRGIEVGVRWYTNTLTGTNEAIHFCFDLITKNEENQTGLLSSLTISAYGDRNVPILKGHHPTFRPLRLSHRSMEERKWKIEIRARREDIGSIKKRWEVISTDTLLDTVSMFLRKSATTQLRDSYSITVSRIEESNLTVGAAEHFGQMIDSVQRPPSYIGALEAQSTLPTSPGIPNVPDTQEGQSSDDRYPWDEPFPLEDNYEQEEIIPRSGWALKSLLPSLKERYNRAWFLDDTKHVYPPRSRGYPFDDGQSGEELDHMDGYRSQ